MCDISKGKSKASHRQRLHRSFVSLNTSSTRHLVQHNTGHPMFSDLRRHMIHPVGSMSCIYTDPSRRDHADRLPGMTNGTVLLNYLACSPLHLCSSCAIPTRLGAVQSLYAAVASYKLSKMSWTSFSASSMMCSGGYCGFHPILLPCSAVKVHLEVTFVSQRNMSNPPSQTYRPPICTPTNSAEQPSASPICSRILWFAGTTESSPMMFLLASALAMAV